ncbi:unnamed protein product [Effrenium voratum]|nr:unnamed protein product [Effrenium voratum]
MSSHRMDMVRQPQRTTVKYQFQVCARNTEVGDKVFLVGGAQELGKWDINKAVELVTTNSHHPSWFRDVEIDPGHLDPRAPGAPHACDQYKYVIRRRSGHEEWEDGPNRYFVNGGSQPGGDFNVTKSGIRLGLLYSNQQVPSLDWVQEEFGKLHSKLCDMKQSMSDELESLKKAQTDLAEKHTSQQTSLQAFRRDFSDFRVKMPDFPSEEELVTKVQKALDSSLQERFRDLQNSVAALEEQLAGIRPSPPSAPSVPAGQPYRPSEVQGEAEPPPEKALEAGPELRAPVADVVKSQFVQRSASHRSSIRPKRGLSSFAGFKTPAKPSDEKLRAIAQQVELDLYASKCRDDSADERRKLLTKVMSRLHDDKGGDKEVVFWFLDWKKAHLKWFFEPHPVPLEALDR